MRTWKGMATAVLALCALFALAVPLVSAQEAPEAQATMEVVDPKEGALNILRAVQAMLAEDALASAGEDAIPTIAEQVVSLLEGEGGANFTPIEGYEGDLHGAIPYLEQLTGRTAVTLAEGDLEALIQANADSPDVLALLHTLLAHRALTGEQVDAAALQSAADHIAQAVSSLGGDGGEAEATN